MIFRTTGCTEYDHPEFTVVFDQEPPTAASPGWILDHLQHAVAGGSRFDPGQSVAIGMHAPRIIDRGDGTLGLEERVGGDAWEEHVDQTMRDLWFQAAAAAKLGLPEDLSSVSDDDFAAVQPCGRDASTLILNRVGPEEQRDFVWAVGCGADHDHLDWVYTDLYRVWSAFPFTAQFLALPAATGVVVHCDRANAVGGVVADVAYGDTVLTPDDGMYFGPEPPAAAPATQAHFAAVKLADGLYRTGVGGRLGHRDIVVRLSEAPVPGLQDSLAQWLLDYLQDSMAAGTRFTPGQTIQVGWRRLLVVERDDDDTLGLQERIGDDSWAEHVELTLRDLWFQKEVVASLGLIDHLSFPADHQSAAVAGCADGPHPALLLSRRAPDADATSGWAVSCADDHDHGDWVTRPLLDLVESRPFAMQFLALPVHSSVTIEAPHTTGTGRIGAHIRLDGRELRPLTGSYLAALAE